MASELSEAQLRNLELAEGGLGSWIAGDREAALATFAEDIEVYVPPELGNAGSFRGIEGFHRWNDSWEEAWSEMEISVEAIEPVGESQVIALMHSRGTGSASGIEVANTLGWVLGIRNDQLAHISLHSDLESARRFALEREGDESVESPR